MGNETDEPASTPDRIARSALVVLARDGLDGLSVRAVGRAAGVAAGTVQHHFATREALLLAAFEQTVSAVAARAADTSGQQPGVEQLEMLLRQLLPLDEQRRVEGAAWVALNAAASSHPGLVVVQHRAVADLTAALTALVAEGQRLGQLDDSMTAAAAARMLSAVVDGLTMHGITDAVPERELLATLDLAVGLLRG